MAARRVLPPDLMTPAKASKPFMKRQRTGGAAAAGEDGVLFAQRGEVRARARAPLEQHALGLGQVEDGFERILHRIDEAGRALGLRWPLVSFLMRSVGFVVSTSRSRALPSRPTLNQTGELKHAFWVSIRWASSLRKFSASSAVAK